MRPRYPSPTPIVIVNGGQPMPPAQAAMSIREFCSAVYFPLKPHIYDKGRWGQQIIVAINRFEAFLGRPAMLADICEQTLTAWMKFGVESGLSVVTVNMRTKHVLHLWRFAKRRRLVPADSDADLVTLFRVPRRLPRAWTVEEFAKILESARLSRGRFMGIDAGKWWEALLLVLYDTGLRKSAAHQVRFDEIDFATKTLRVPAERMKNLVEQYFLLHDQTIEAICEILVPRRALVFPFPFKHHRAIYGRFRRILKRAGLPFTRFDLFHKIRRTTASHIARMVGEPLAIQQLGHRDASCIRRYIDPRFTASHDASKLLPRAAWLNPREITVEVPAIASAEPLPAVTVRYSQEILRGEGRDVFQALYEKSQTCDLEGPDVADAMEAIGISRKEFAEEVGIDARYFGQILRGKMPIGHRLDQQIRIKLGLEPARDYPLDRLDKRRHPK